MKLQLLKENLKAYLEECIEGTPDRSNDKHKRTNYQAIANESYAPFTSPRGIWIHLRSFRRWLVNNGHGFINSRELGRDLRTLGCDWKIGMRGANAVLWNVLPALTEVKDGAKKNRQSVRSISPNDGGNERSRANR